VTVEGGRILIGLDGAPPVSIPVSPAHAVLAPFDVGTLVGARLEEIAREGCFGRNCDILSYLARTMW
jgi:hypothetical protein